MRRIITTLLGILLVAGLAAPAAAEYPDRPVTRSVSYPPAASLTRGPARWKA
jgi:hypothetical protein